LREGEEFVALDGAGVVLESILLETPPKHKERREDAEEPYFVQLHETLP